MSAYFYAMIALIPFSIGYIWREPFAISYLNLWSVGFIFLWVLSVGTHAIKLELPRNKHYVLFTGVYLIGIIWATFATPNLRDVLGLWTSRLIQPFLVGLGAWLCLRNGLVNIRGILLAFVAAIAGMTAVALMQAAGILTSPNPTRVVSIYEWPNTFARIQAYLLLMVTPLLCEKGKLRTALLIVGGLAIAALLASISYNGVVTFSIGAIVVLLLSHIHRRIKIFALSTAILVALVIGIFPTKAIPEWQIRTDTSRNARLEFWLIAEGVFKEKPWTGLGIKGWENDFPSLLEKYHPFQPPYNAVSSQPHNLLLDALMKGGIPMLIGVLAFMSWPVIAGLRIVKKGHMIGLAILGASVMLFLFGTIDDPIWADDMMPIIFIVQAIGLYELSRDTSTG